MVEKILDEDKKRDYRDVLCMPPMPSMPPLRSLAAAEMDLRRSTSLGLGGVINQLLSDPAIRNDYWVDWCKIFASHRASKLNATITANSLLDSTTFQGYKFFVEKKS